MTRPAHSFLLYGSTTTIITHVAAYYVLICGGIIQIIHECSPHHLMQEDPLTLAISALTPEAQQQVQLTDLVASNDDLLRLYARDISLSLMRP